MPTDPTSTVQPDDLSALAEPADATWVIEPAGPLTGDVRVRGSKNAVTKHMVAALLGGSESRIQNAPALGDVDLTAAMLRSLGADVEHTGDEVVVDPTGVGTGSVPLRFSGLNRIPILFLGPLLHRVGEVFVPLVGGDAIGGRPVDFHVDALRMMGAEVHQTSEGIEAKASRLHGARIRLPYPSVMATESVLLSAVLAEGRTVLEGSAVEPEVIELALFLQRMGAGIELKPDRRFVIEGVGSLRGASHHLAGDRIEAFSYIVAGLATGGRVRVLGCPQSRLVTAISTLQRMGAQFEIDDESIAATPGEGGLRSISVSTDTHPGFMTDWQSPLVVLMTQAEGMSVLHETVFENRFGYTAALKQMGAEVELYDACLGGPACRFYESSSGHSLVVRGRTPLSGAEIEIPDIRGGFAHVLAAAAASGRSVVHGTHHLERGYHKPIERLAALGLEVERRASEG